MFHQQTDASSSVPLTDERTSGPCSSSGTAAAAAAAVGPLHLRQRLRRSSLLTGLVLAGSGSASAYSPNSPSSPPPVSRLSARQILSTARILREERRVAHSSTVYPVNLPPELYAELFETTPESLRRSILGDGGDADLRDGSKKENGQQDGGERDAAVYSWTETLFDEPEFLSDDVLNVRLDSQIASRVQDELNAVNKLSEATGSEVPDVEARLRQEAERKRRMSTSLVQDVVKDIGVSAKKGTKSMNKIVKKKVTLSAKKSKNTGDKSASRKVTVSRSKVASKSKVIASKKVAAKSKISTSKKPSISAGIDTPTAFITKSKDRTNNRKKKSAQLSTLTDRPERITPEEEIELARLIQRGSNLHNVKTDFEAKHHRDITRQEWADLANIESPRELRRLVSEYRQAKSKLVTANLGLVYAVVRGNAGNRLRAAGLSEDELVQEGSLGLLRAAELFDPEKGLRFSTYATIWIKGQLSNSHVDEVIALPMREKAKWNKIRTAARDLTLQSEGSSGDGGGMKKPKIRDVARLSGLSEQDVEAVTAKMERASKLISLDYQYKSTTRSGADNEQVTGFDNEKSLQTDADLIEHLQIRADVIAALTRNLTPEEVKLLRLRYGLTDGRARTLAECAEEMGCSRDKARMLANKCLKKLKEADEADGLQEYLLTVA